MNFREKLMRWMVGRNGVDELARAEMWIVMAGLVLSIFIRVLYFPTLLLMVHTYFRVFSRNTSKRYAENQKWRDMCCRLRNRTKGGSGAVGRILNMPLRGVRLLKKRWRERGVYRYFKCPQCKQKVRVPAGHGKICITCPRCRTEFVKRS